MRYKYSYDQVVEMFKEDKDTPPFIFYYYSDKSGFDKLSDHINPKTNKPWIDPFDDFMIDERGHIMMKIDFSFINMHMAREAAIAYETNYNDLDYRRWVTNLDIPSTEARGKYFYCKHRSGTKPYNEFWGREYTRRTQGITIPGKLMDDNTIQDLHLTGDHYHFLNYSRIKRNLTEKEKEYYESIGLYKKKTIEGFPMPWDGHYWKHKLSELASRNAYNTCDSKARRKGYSYIRGSGSANTMNTVPGITIAIGSWDTKYLTGNDATLEMVKRNLDWLELNTHWRRFYLSEDLMNLKLGYRKKKFGNAEFGYKSALVGASLFNNPKGFVGKGAQEVDIEEGGVCPNLESTMDVTTSATESGDESVGIIRIYGTGGEAEADWIGFSKIFYNNLYDTIKLRNVWDFNQSHTSCGYFHPQILNYYPYMDEDGNSDLVEAWKADKARAIEAKSKLSTAKYIVYRSQRANRPEEAFRRSKDNRFASPELYDHIRVVEHNPDIRTWKDGMFRVLEGDIQYMDNDTMEQKGETIHPYIDRFPAKTDQDFHGCFRMFHPPIEEASKYDDLYVGVYDPVAKDKETKTISKKDSLDSFMIFGNPYNKANISVPILNLTFAGRFNSNEDVHRQIAYANMFYHCKTLPEVDRGNIVTNYRNWRLLNLLHRNPLSYINNKILQNVATDYGIYIGESNLADDGLLYLYDFLYTIVGRRDNGSPIFMFNQINDLPTLLELAEFDKLRNFDRISAMRIFTFMLMYYKRYYKEESHRDNNDKKNTFLSKLNAY